jgi:hypothetical protein
VHESLKKESWGEVRTEGRSKSERFFSASCPRGCADGANIIAPNIGALFPFVTVVFHGRDTAKFGRERSGERMGCKELFESPTSLLILVET